jgi:hypothetical protein
VLGPMLGVFSLGEELLDYVPLVVALAIAAVGLTFAYRVYEYASRCAYRSDVSFCNDAAPDPVGRADYAEAIYIERI